MSRETVLRRIRERLGATESDELRRSRALTRLSKHAANTIPARARVTGQARVAAFTDMLERVHGSVAIVAGLDEIPAAISEYLGGGGELALTQEVVCMNLPWHEQRLLHLVPWSAKTGFAVCVTACIGAAAETGTIVVRSSSQIPLTQHFLGERHIVIVEAAQLYGAYEDVFPLVRDDMPRHLTMVSGPSCTGDIEMIMEYGAHGPRNLHVILVKRSPAADPREPGA